MSEPRIDEQLFQTWVPNQAQGLLSGSGRLDDLVLLCGSPFHDGWLQALSPGEAR